MPVVCVASSFPELHNVNLGIVDNLAEGMASVVGADNTHRLPFGTIADHVTQIKPDAVIMVGSALHHNSDFRAVARAAEKAGAVFAFWTVEDPYEFDYRYKFVDLADVVFTNDLWAQKFYDRDKVHFLPTAASPRHYRPIGSFSRRDLDVFFCGVAFDVRQRLIADALPVLEHYRSQILGDNWPDFESGVVRNRRLSGERLIDYYAASKFVLNIGRDLFLANDQRGLQAVTPGPRTFEAAMAGCVQLCYQPSYALFDSFQDGEEIVSFQTVDDLADQLKRLTSNLDEAEAIAKRAQQRAQRDHTYEARARTMLKHLGLGADWVTRLKSAK